MVLAESEFGPTMNAHVFMNYELEFDINNQCICIEEESLGVLNGRDDAMSLCKLVMRW